MVEIRQGLVVSGTEPVHFDVAVCGDVLFRHQAAGGNGLDEAETHDVAMPDRILDPMGEQDVAPIEVPLRPGTRRFHRNSSGQSRLGGRDTDHRISV
jgi:hypothetical protein